MRLSKPYPTTSKSLKSDNVKIFYYANIIGDTFVQTWYTVRIECAWRIITRHFDTLREAKVYIKNFIPTDTSNSTGAFNKTTINLVEHVADSHVIDWKN